MQHLSHILFPHSILDGANNSRFGNVPLSRSKAIEPVDKGTYILPLKQSFMKNRRIMDSTARLVALISGWAGQGGPIKTTQGILAKHMGKSVRQVQRMLKDAWREGYLTYAYTKNRIGMITGICIYLRFERIRRCSRAIEDRRKVATTSMADTNGNRSLNRKDSAVEDRLRQLSIAMGLPYPPDK